MELNAQAWSEYMFGDGRLGDKRRTRRLVDMAGRLASHAGQSLASCCRSSATTVLGSYRFIENTKVIDNKISEAAFAKVAAEAAPLDVILAVEDTTTMLYKHSVAEDLGTAGSSPEPRQRGYLVHSALLVDAQSESTVGLIEQRYWCRPDGEYEKKHYRKQRAYEDKESHKWQSASEQVRASRSAGNNADPLELNAVAVREHGDSGHAPLNWTLLTSEPIDTDEHVRNIVRF